jgi:FKBP12-rapamycin complex-associated protein
MNFYSIKFSLLRNNNDSILAVLEAFVYDPVLNWRLTESSARKPTGFAERVGAETDEQQQLTGSHSDAISRVKAKLTGLSNTIELFTKIVFRPRF